MFCEKCGMMNPDQSRFCFKCGAPLPEIPVKRPEQGRPGNTQNYGAQQNAQNYGAQRYGAQQGPQNYGAQQNTQNYGAQQGPQNFEPRQNAQNYGAPKKKGTNNSRNLIIGIVLAIIIAAGGIAAFFIVSNVLNNGSGTAAGGQNQTGTVTPGLTPEPGQKPGTPVITASITPAGALTPAVTPSPAVTAAPTAIPTATPAPTAIPTATPVPTAIPTATATPTPTPTPSPEPVTFSLVSPGSAGLGAMGTVRIRDVAESSVIVQEGYDNSGEMAVDGDETTSWQPAENSGPGEFLDFYFTREENIRCITFKLGNWRNDEMFDWNNRPKDIILTVGDVVFGETFDITFPDGKTEYCVKFSRPIPASQVLLTIRTVYSGSHWNDTAISEVTFYTE